MRMTMDAVENDQEHQKFSNRLLSSSDEDT
jgi:hypothetical protein